MKNPYAINSVNKSSKDKSLKGRTSKDESSKDRASKDKSLKGRASKGRTSKDKPVYVFDFSFFEIFTCLKGNINILIGDKYDLLKLKRNEFYDFEDLVRVYELIKFRKVLVDNSSLLSLLEDFSSAVSVSDIVLDKDKFEEELLSTKEFSSLIDSNNAYLSSLGYFNKNNLVGVKDVAFDILVMMESSKTVSLLDLSEGVRSLDRIDSDLEIESNEDAKLIVLCYCVYEAYNSFLRFPSGPCLDLYLLASMSNRILMELKELV